jgi:hypothetical protein
MLRSSEKFPGDNLTPRHKVVKAGRTFSQEQFSTVVLKTLWKRGIEFA